MLVVAPETIDFDISTLINTEADRRREIPPPELDKITYEDNALIVHFSDLMLYPELIHNFTNDNYGAEVFSINYVPSEASKDLFYEKGI